METSEKRERGRPGGREGEKCLRKGKEGKEEGEDKKKEGEERELRKLPMGELSLEQRASLRMIKTIHFLGIWKFSRGRISLIKEPAGARFCCLMHQKA